MDLKLERLDGYSEFPGPLVMVVMDGMGLGKGDEADGVRQAKTPVLDALLKEPLFLPLRAHGKAVGLPSDGDMGNSEVGHNALGAGRVFSQGAMLVNDAIGSGKIFEGKAWKALLEKAGAGGTVHFIGLVSITDGHIAQTAGTNGTAHCAVTDQADHSQCDTGKDSRKSFF